MRQHPSKESGQGLARPVRVPEPVEQEMPTSSTLDRDATRNGRVDPTAGRAPAAPPGGERADNGND
jgi:hypothetical protein